METNLADFIRGTDDGDRAESILRKCVHCGFCTATCPTYQLLGDELDGPRGRIYLIKQALEGQPVTRRTQHHLDRCLTCRSCETTCPSGVKYGELVDIGRHVVESRVSRPWGERLLRRALRVIVPHAGRFRTLVKLGQAARALLPSTLKEKVPVAKALGSWPQSGHKRRMLVLSGCAQPGIAPHINTATARVLDAIGISLVEVSGAGCCGALSHHLSAPDETQTFMKNNIDAWWPHIEAGAEAIVITASACAAMVKDYGPLLARDPEYGPRAARIASLAKDVSEVLADEDTSTLGRLANERVAFHSPCTLQHGLGIRGTVEAILENHGFQLTQIQDAHLCCGSAGTYSILQPTLSSALRTNKLVALTADRPDYIATANVGCYQHLQGGTAVPVVHWIELLDPARPLLSLRS